MDIFRALYVVTALVFWPLLALAESECIAVTAPFSLYPAAVKSAENITGEPFNEASGTLLRTSDFKYQVVVGKVVLEEGQNLKYGLHCESVEELTARTLYKLSVVGHNIHDNGWKSYRADFELPTETLRLIDECYKPAFKMSLTKQSCARAYTQVSDVLEVLIEQGGATEDGGLSSFKETLLHRSCYESRSKLLCGVIVLKYKNPLYKWQEKFARMATVVMEE